MDSGMTIDELAQAAGTTSRNVRAYRSRGLLPPPRLVGRTGFYDETHLSRLRLIARLQARGFALQAIGELLAAWEEGSSLSDVLGFSEALLAPWNDETAEAVSRRRLAELFPEVVAEPALVDRAVELGLLMPEGEGFRVPSPRLLRVGAELVASGIPLAAVLDQAEALGRDMGAVARRFVELFTVHIWLPFISGQLPGRQLADITGDLQRLRPLAAEAVHAFLAQAMDREVAAATVEGLRAQLEAAGPGASEAAGS